jgi:hypothetical protein
MPTPDYAAIRKTLEATLDQLNGKQPLVEPNKADIEDAINILAEMEKINTPTLANQIGQFISIENASDKRLAFKENPEWKSAFDKLPVLLRPHPLLVSAALLRQLLKFERDAHLTEIIQIFPAIRANEEGKLTYTQIMIALDNDRDRKPILAKDLPPAVRDAIRTELQNMNRPLSNDEPADALDEIRLCPPENCDDIA